MLEIWGAFAIVTYVSINIGLLSEPDLGEEPVNLLSISTQAAAVLASVAWFIWWPWVFWDQYKQRHRK